MSIRKRENGIYYIDIRTPGGNRVRQTAGTTDKAQAQELHDKIKHELWRVAKFGERPLHTFDEAALRFLQESAGTADYANKWPMERRPCPRGRNRDRAEQR